MSDVVFPTSHSPAPDLEIGEQPTDEESLPDKSYVIMLVDELASLYSEPHSSDLCQNIFMQSSEKNKITSIKSTRRIKEDANIFVAVPQHPSRVRSERQLQREYTQKPSWWQCNAGWKRRG